ncbi:hypothetical protein T439DRAFT_322954 [Meredithblackwellia eburnea MCA 4105]
MAALPKVPDGTNPFQYWDAVVNSIFYYEIPSGFRARLIVLTSIVVYVVIAAIIYFTLTLVDYRRKDRRVWLWRLVDRPTGRLIVGNQQILEPLLTIISGVIFLAHMSNEYQVWIFQGPQSQTPAWRLSIWTALFLQSWVVGWASFQGFIITSGRHTFGIRSLKPWHCNTLFLAGGALQAGALLAYNIITANGGRKYWRDFVSLRHLLEAEAPKWTGNTDLAVVDQANAIWTKLLVEIAEVYKLTNEILWVFVGATLLTTFINLTSIGMVVLVRRQIRVSQTDLNHLRTLGSLSHLPPMTQPEVPTTSRAQIESSVSSPGGLHAVEIELTPATPHVRQTDEEGEQDVVDADASCSTSPPQELQTSDPGVNLSVYGNVDEEEGPNTAKNGRSSKRSSRSISRSDIRHMAFKIELDGGFRGAHAKNLMALHRAETDLLVTGVSLTVMMVSISVLCIWAVQVLPHLRQLPFFATEAVTFLGTWIYGVISAVALSFHCWNSWIHLDRRQFASAATSPQANAGFSRTTDSEKAVGERSRPGFHEMLREGPNIPSARGRGRPVESPDMPEMSNWPSEASEASDDSKGLDGKVEEQT